MPKCNYCFDNPKGVYTGVGAWAGEWISCPMCSTKHVTVRVRDHATPRLIAKARGLDGDDTNLINERLSNGNE